MPAAPPPTPAAPPPTPAAPPPTPIALRRGVPAACPYCATLLDPAPDRGRLCPRCRRRIVIRQVDGRRVLFTEEALGVFEAERDRETRERTWTSERRRWLALAKGVSAPVNRVARLAAAPPSDAVVAASKDLYLVAAERAARKARREKRWEDVARIRREQAAALYRASGSAIPPPDEVVTLHRVWSAAALRSFARFGAQVELVAAGCCATCERDNGQVFRVAAELRTQRLPHAGCPKGLCPCDWWPVPGATPRGRRVRRRDLPRAGTMPAPVADLVAGPVSAVESEPAASALSAVRGSTAVTPSPTAAMPPDVARAPSPAAATPSSSVPITPITPTVTTAGFAVAAADIVAYYESRGYEWSARQPRTKSLGLFFRSCEKVDDAGRTCVVGVVTDPSGGLADAFASVQATATETVLAPSDALKPLAGFLAATFGEDQGAAVLPWLAGHLGDAYAETKLGPITLATYTESKDDHSKLYVEVANQTYLDTPLGEPT